MRVIELPAGVPARERGRRHGEAAGPEIGELAEIRTDLVVELGRFRDRQQVLDVAARHLPVLSGFDRDLHDELLGIAEGAGRDPAEIVVLNHYTDLRDLDLSAAAGPLPPGAEEGCSALFTRTPGGPLLGQTWDMHGSAARYVVALSVPPPHAAVLLTVAGCLGLAGMNAHGVGVVINNLRCTDARVGLVWPALVRRVLRERSASRGCEIVETAPVGSGHHYLIADPDTAFGIEVTGTARERVYEGHADTFAHTNHCLVPALARHTDLVGGSTTHERYRRLAEHTGREPVSGMDALWQLLGSHEGYPRSICTHLASPARPHAMATCGGLAMDLARKEMWLDAGCLNRSRPLRLRVGDGGAARGEQEPR